MILIVICFFMYISFGLGVSFWLHDRRGYIKEDGRMEVDGKHLGIGAMFWVYVIVPLLFPLFLLIEFVIFYNKKP